MLKISLIARTTARAVRAGARAVHSPNHWPDPHDTCTGLIIVLIKMQVHNIILYQACVLIES